MGKRMLEADQLRHEFTGQLIPAHPEYVRVSDRTLTIHLKKGSTESTEWQCQYAQEPKWAFQESSKLSLGLQRTEADRALPTSHHQKS